MTTGNPSSASLWSGRALSLLVTLVMIADAAVDLFHPSLVQAEMAATGFPEGQVHLVGAICTHFRVGEIATAPQLVSLLLGGSAWGALYLRDLRVRTLLPLVD